MTSKKFDIDKIYVAAPCPVPWETMRGDERKRHCDMCSLSIYNVSEMTVEEVKHLLGSSEGRICGRIYRRADGTVQTKDCPVGIRAYRKRVARYAGATLSMILGLFSFGFGQVDPKRDVNGDAAAISKKDKEKDTISGILTDSNGAVIPNMKVILKVDIEDKGVTVQTNDEGEYSFAGVKPGKYLLEVPKAAGFKRSIVENVKIESGERKVVDMALEVETGTVVVGIFGEPPLIDTSSPGGTTVITSDMLRRRP